MQALTLIKPKHSASRVISIGTSVLIWSVTSLIMKSANANIGESFGFGSRSAGLMGASVTGGYEGYASYANPAALSLSRDRRLVVSWGLLSMSPQFTPIRDIIVENETTSDEVHRGDVTHNYRATLGQSVGVSYLVAPEWMNFALGVTTFVPIQQFAYVDTGEIYIPEYVLYRARTQRPQFELAASFMPVEGLHIGAGVHIGFSLTGNANVFIQTSSDKPSTMRFSSSLTPKGSPYLGILFAPGHQAGLSTDPNTPLSIGAVVRFPLESQANIILNSGARVFGSFAGVDFAFTSRSALYYDPLSIEIGARLKLFDRWTTQVQLDYQAWQDFVPPALTLQEPSANCSNADASACGINVSGSNNPVPTFKNILIPRIAQELQISDAWSIRAAYARNPGMIDQTKSDLSEAGNLLDPPKHMISLGIGRQFAQFFGHAIPIRVDAHASAHLLETQTITKNPGDELGNGSGDLKIGAPGYQAGGKILGGGVSLSLAF